MSDEKNWVFFRIVKKFKMEFAYPVPLTYEVLTLDQSYSGRVFNIIVLNLSSKCSILIRIGFISNFPHEKSLHMTSNLGFGWGHWGRGRFIFISICMYLLCCNRSIVNLSKRSITIDIVIVNFCHISVAIR